MFNDAELFEFSSLGFSDDEEFIEDSSDEIENDLDTDDNVFSDDDDFEEDDMYDTEFDDSLEEDDDIDEPYDDIEEEDGYGNKNNNSDSITDNETDFPDDDF